MDTSLSFRTNRSHCRVMMTTKTDLMTFSCNKEFNTMALTASTKYYPSVIKSCSLLHFHLQHTPTLTFKQLKLQVCFAIHWWKTLSMLIEEISKAVPSTVELLLAVPLGSDLGLLLFILYMADMPPYSKAILHLPPLSR